MKGRQGQELEQDADGERAGEGGINLKEMILAGVLEPGQHALRILYKGRVFFGDLDESGAITDCASGVQYTKPSGWSLACKRSVLPSVRADSGWVTIRVVPPEARRHNSAASESTASCAGLRCLSDYRDMLGSRGSGALRSRGLPAQLGSSDSRGLRWVCAMCSFENEGLAAARACSSCSLPRSESEEGRRLALRSRAALPRAAAIRSGCEQKQEGDALTTKVADNEDDDEEEDLDVEVDYSESRCMVCHSGRDASLMLLCDACDEGVHVYCSRAPLSGALADHIEGSRTRWLCADCTPPAVVAGLPTHVDLTQIVEVRFARHEAGQGVASAELEFVLSNGARVSESALSDTQRLAFFRGDGLRRLVAARARDGLHLQRSEAAREMAGKTWLERSFAFGNGTPFGVVQFEGLFSDEELNLIEREVRWRLDTEGLSALDACSVDVSLVKRRIKVFLGYRYSYGKKAKSREPQLFDDVNTMDEGLPSSLPLIVRRLEERGLVEPGFFNQAVINGYYPGASLGVHCDDPALFERPIWSLRLFAPCVLSFGCAGIGMVETEAFAPFPLARGCVTRMAGIAANNSKHCVRAQDVTDFTVSIILRKVRLEKLVRKDPVAVAPEALPAVAVAGAGVAAKAGLRGPAVARDKAPVVATSSALREATASSALRELVSLPAVSVGAKQAEQATAKPPISPRLPGSKKRRPLQFRAADLEDDEDEDRPTKTQSGH